MRGGPVSETFHLVDHLPRLSQAISPGTKPYKVVFQALTNCKEVAKKLWPRNIGQYSRTNWKTCETPNTHVQATCGVKGSWSRGVRASKHVLKRRTFRKPPPQMKRLPSCWNLLEPYMSIVGPCRKPGKAVPTEPGRSCSWWWWWWWSDHLNFEDRTGPNQLSWRESKVFSRAKAEPRCREIEASAVRFGIALWWSRTSCQGATEAAKTSRLKTNPVEHRTMCTYFISCRSTSPAAQSQCLGKSCLL